MAHAHKLPPSSHEELSAQLAKIEDIKRQWLATLDAIHDPIAIIDENYRIQKSNTSMARLTPHGDVRKIIGEKCHKIFAGQDLPCAGCPALKALKEHRSQEFTYQRPSDDKVFEISSFPIEHSHERLIVQVYRDRTFQRKIEEKIRQHDKLTSLGFLAGGIAHEINNPLSGILLFSQMILKELRQGDDHYQDIVEIEAAAQRCKEIVQQILDFSRQSSYVPDPNLERVSLSDVMNTAMRLAQVLKVAKETQVMFEMTSENVEVWGCRSRLIQVFLNLFKNAFQAMPQGGTLYVMQSFEKVDGTRKAVVEVRDTGVGISQEHLPKIFDPFFTTKNQGEGTGLGLAICYGIMRELGGKLTAISKPGVGSSFYVSLKAVGPEKERILRAVPKDSSQ